MSSILRPDREPDQRTNEPIEPEPEPGRAMDSELKVMSAIIRTLDKESPEARSRIVAYISHRYVKGTT